jgi:hypothetical protein
MVRTIVPLRVIGIISMVFFIAYGALAGAITTFLLYLLSLPINVIRSGRCSRWSRRRGFRRKAICRWTGCGVHDAAKYKKGEILFKKGDLARRCSTR